MSKLILSEFNGVNSYRGFSTQDIALRPTLNPLYVYTVDLEGNAILVSDNETENLGTLIDYDILLLQQNGIKITPSHLCGLNRVNSFAGFNTAIASLEDNARMVNDIREAKELSNQLNS